MKPRIKSPMIMPLMRKAIAMNEHLSPLFDSILFKWMANVTLILLRKTYFVHFLRIPRYMGTRIPCNTSSSSRLRLFRKDPPFLELSLLMQLFLRVILIWRFVCRQNFNELELVSFMMRKGVEENVKSRRKIFLKAFISIIYRAYYKAFWSSQSGWKNQRK